MLEIEASKDFLKRTLIAWEGTRRTWVFMTLKDFWIAKETMEQVKRWPSERQKSLY